MNDKLKRFFKREILIPKFYAPTGPIKLVLLIFQKQHKKMELMELMSQIKKFNIKF